MKVLVIGRRAFAAQGLVDRLRAVGVEADAVSAAQFPAQVPASCANGCDVVIDFGFLHGAGLDANRDRLAAVYEWSNAHGVVRMIGISSMGVYPIDATEITSATPVEKDPSLRGVYSSVKVMQEKFYDETPRAFALEIVRPGVIYDEVTHEVKTGGVFIRLFGRFGILMGDSRATLPVVTRQALQEFLVRRVTDGGVQTAERSETVVQGGPPGGRPLPCVHVLARASTKVWFARHVLGVVAIPLSRGLALFCAAALARLGIFTPARLSQVRGLFRRYVLHCGVRGAPALPTLD